jgi:hypothetical protein
LERATISLDAGIRNENIGSDVVLKIRCTIGSLQRLAA